MGFHFVSAVWASNINQFFINSLRCLLSERLLKFLSVEFKIGGHHLVPPFDKILHQKGKILKLLGVEPNELFQRDG